MFIKIQSSSLNSTPDNAFVIFDQSTDSLNSVLNEDELAYVKSQLADKKNVLFLNRYTSKIWVVNAEKKDNSAAQLENIRVVGSKLNAALNAVKVKEVNIQSNLNDSVFEFALLEGLAFSNYQFFPYKKDVSKEKFTLETIGLEGFKTSATEIEHLNALQHGVFACRDLVNKPANLLNAEQLAESFENFGKEAGIKVEVFGKAKIESLKMGGLLSVNKGSIDPPTFTIMEYKPANAVNEKPYVLVGKGVVYDTGGLSLKPTANSMDYMKCDMAGGALVGCSIYAIAKAKLPVYIVGLIPATDNRPGENAFAPGDVITMYNGMTVEMLNSDAEGRMILADALSYADQYKPEAVFNFATLTGAAAAAIGSYAAVTMGNISEDLKAKVKISAERVHERVAEFPFWDEYYDLLKSDIADMKNIGGPVGGAITAGKFLEKYTTSPFYHFDIAAPAYLKAAEGYRSKNGSGYGVRMLFDFFKSLN